MFIKDSPTLLSIAAAVVLAPVLWTTLGRVLRQYLTSKLTILNDIPKLGQGSRREKKIAGTAVICGGSIAGLWTARICADHFEKVIVIEPDTWIHDQKQDINEYDAVPTKEQDGITTIVNKRGRVAQYHGIHGYQPMALTSFRQLFPNVDAEARAMGIRISPLDMHVFVGGIPISAPVWDYGSSKTSPAGGLPEVMIASRASLETLLRKLVQESPDCKNVEFLLGTVTGVIPSETSPNQLAGVHVRTESQKELQVVTGKLIIDCTGPTQGFFKWLPRAGYGSSDSKNGQKPLSNLRLSYEHNMKYSCVRYSLTPEMEMRLSTKLPPDWSTSPEYNSMREGWDNAGWLFAVAAIPEVDSRGMMGKKGKDNWVELAFGGWELEFPPKTNAEILEFIDSLKCAPGYSLPKWIYDFIRMLAGEDQPEPIVSFYPSPPACSIEYHKASNLPSNFVAIGDSVMMLNPVFGQGCSKALIGAVTLNALLDTVRKDLFPNNFSKKFFQMQYSRTEGFWTETKGQDYRVQTTRPVPGEEKEMEKSLQTQGGFAAKFEQSLMKLAVRDKEIASTLWHVFTMLAPTTDLLAPRVLVKVVWAKLTGAI